MLTSDLGPGEPGDKKALQQAERSRHLHIGPLASGFNLVAALPANVFRTGERLALPWRNRRLEQASKCAAKCGKTLNQLITKIYNDRFKIKT